MSRLPAFDRASQAREQTTLAAEKAHLQSRNRTLARVVVGMLLVHVAVVTAVLALVVTSDSDADARQARMALMQSRPQHPSQRHHQPEMATAWVSTPAARAAAPTDTAWASARHKDQPAPWQLNADGGLVAR